MWSDVSQSGRAEDSHAMQKPLQRSLGKLLGVCTSQLVRSVFIMQGHPDMEVEGKFLKIGFSEVCKL